MSEPTPEARNAILRDLGRGHCTDCTPEDCPCWDREQELRRASLAKANPEE